MALPALATVEQLAGWMQVDAGTLPASASSTLEMVSAIVRAEARQNFNRATTTLTRTPDRVTLSISLPLRPVVSVDAVTRGGVPIDHRWDDETGRLYVDSCTPVSVAFTYGYASVPGDVVAVVLTAAQRVLSNPNDLRQETVGSMSVTYAAETIGASLSPADKDLLGRYRRRFAVMRVL